MFKGIDLYSDTVTQPSVAMKEIMMQAEVGDEQIDGDPTTRKLEEMVAELLGQDTAMFFPSATMANEVAIRLLCEPGDELIAAGNCHLFFAETGGPAIHANVLARPIYSSNGVFTGEELRQHYFWPKGPHYPVSKLVSIENTTNMGGGVAWTAQDLASVFAVTQELGLKTHLDGARLFNAVVRTGLSAQEIAKRFDAVTLCFSKGLGCGMGAILAFAQEHYGKVRRLKQLMGGALRQSGMLAAACLYALQNNVARLQQDHDNAQFLAAQLSDNIPQIQVQYSALATNMVFFTWYSDQMTPDQFAENCLHKGLRFSRPGANRFRAVTHLGVTRDDMNKAVAIVREICSR